MAIGTRPGVVACRPHLVLPHVGDDDGITVCFCTDRFQDGDWIGMYCVAWDSSNVVLILCLIVAYLADPRTVIAWLNGLNQSFQGSFSIGHNRYGCRFDLVHLRGVDINVDKACTRCELTRFPGDAVIEAQPHTDDQVGDTNGTVDMRGSMHPRHANSQ